MFGAWLAAFAGAWFAVGSTLSPLWNKGAVSGIGSPVGGTVARAAEQIGFFTGLGVVIAIVAGAVIGRLSVVAVRDARLAESRDARRATSRKAEDDEALRDPVVYDSTADNAAASDSATADSAATDSAATDSAGADSAGADRTSATRAGAGPR
jgi:uncharacterized membrane protein YedE/YeeE